MNDLYTVSGCIVSYNNVGNVKNAIESILKHTKGVNINLFVSDNGSVDGTESVITDLFPQVEFIQNSSNIGFGAAHNKVINIINSKYHVVINPDIIINDDVISKLCNYLDNNPDVVMVTPKILYNDGTEQKLPKRKPNLKYLLARRMLLKASLNDEYVMADHSYDNPFDIDFCTGCFFVIRTEIFKKVNGFDERYFMYFEDADLTLMVKRHGRVVFYPDVSVTHLWTRDSAKKLKYFLIHVSSMIKFLFKNSLKKER